MTIDTLDRSFLEAFVFYNIKTFEEQETALNPRVLQAIADIFVQNQMHNQYGAGILHRHQVLEEGCVMVHTKRSAEIAVCQSKSVNDLDVTQLVPTSLFLNEERNFQGLEYGINGEKIELGNKFAYQLRAFLIANQLERIIAVIPKLAIDGGDCHDSIEFMHPSGNGTVRIPRQQAGSADSDITEPVITEWGFSKNKQGIIQCKGNTVCSPQNNGKHRVFIDSKLHCLGSWTGGMEAGLSLGRNEMVCSWGRHNTGTVTGVAMQCILSVFIFASSHWDLRSEYTAFIYRWLGFLQPRMK